MLSVVEPERSARRLVEEAVRELRATGGAIVDGSDRPVATAGTWPVPPVVRLPIPGGSRRVGTLLVGPRVDGRPHDPRSIAELEDVAALVAAAVRLGPPAEPD